jgi:hypothetical protein
VLNELYGELSSQGLLALVAWVIISGASC